MRWKNLSGAFHGAANLETLHAGKVDTSMVVDMSYLITGASKLTAINLTGINTSAVLNLEYLFFNNERLTNLDLSMFDTSNVTNMSYIFHNATRVENLNVNNWDVRAVISNLFWNTNLGALGNGLTIFCNDPDGGGTGASGTGAIFGESCN